MDCQKKTILTHYIIEIREDNFYEETRFQKMQVCCSSIAKVVQRRGFIAVYVNPLVATIIPDRAFSSQAHRLEFLSTLKAKIGTP